MVGSRTEGLGQCGTVGRWDVVWGGVERCCNVGGGMLWWEELWCGAACGLIHTHLPIYCNMCTICDSVGAE